MALDITVFVSPRCGVIISLAFCQIENLVQDIVSDGCVILCVARVDGILSRIRLVRVLVVGEEEELVLDDRTTQCETKQCFLLLVVWFGERAIHILIVAAYQVLIVAIEVSTSMEVVSTTLGNCIDGTTGETTLTNIEWGDVDLNLLDGLHRDRLGTCLTTIATIRGKTEHVIVHHTINLE